MISKYLKSKNLISQIRATIDESRINDDYSELYYYLNLQDLRFPSYEYKNLFNNYQLEKILAIGNKLPREPATVTAKNRVDESIRESTVSWIPVNSQTRWIYEKITDCINLVNDSYFNYDLTKFEKLQFTRYYGNKKGMYGSHLDSLFGYYPDDRKLSFVMQLSDPSEYEGGDLVLHSSKNPEFIRKEKGLMVFFPSNTLHECTPVTSGERITLVGWIHGPKFK